MARLFWPTLACITVGTCFAGPAYISTQPDELNTPTQLQTAPEPAFSWLDEVWNFLMFGRSAPPVPDTLASLDLPDIPAPSLCLVEPLPPLTAADARAFEDGDAIDTASLTPATVKALNRFQRVVSKVGGQMVLTSAYRPATYQEHLQAVWDRWMQLRNNVSPGCQTLKEEVGAEFERHQLLVRQRPVAFSDHTLGIGFDAAVTLPRKRSRKRFSIDRLARMSGVRRPDIRRDPVHFRLVAGS